MTEDLTLHKDKRFYALIHMLNLLIILIIILVSILTKAYLFMFIVSVFVLILILLNYSWIKNPILTMNDNRFTLHRTLIGETISYEWSKIQEIDEIRSNYISLLFKNGATVRINDTRYLSRNDSQKLVQFLYDKFGPERYKIKGNLHQLYKMNQKTYCKISNPLILSPFIIIQLILIFVSLYGIILRKFWGTPSLLIILSILIPYFILRLRNFLRYIFLVDKEKIICSGGEPECVKAIPFNDIDQIYFVSYYKITFKMKTGGFANLDLLGLSKIPRQKLITIIKQHLNFSELNENCI